MEAIWSAAMLQVAQERMRMGEYKQPEDVEFLE